MDQETSKYFFFFFTLAHGLNERTDCLDYERLDRLVLAILVNSRTFLLIVADESVEAGELCFEKRPQCRLVRTY